MGIELYLTPCENVRPDSSYFWNLPQLPPTLKYPMTRDRKGHLFVMQFVAQINCAELSASVTNRELPQTGMLYFFADIASYLQYDVNTVHGLGQWSGGVKVLYSPEPAKTVSFTNPYGETELIMPHAIEFDESEERDSYFTLLGEPYDDEPQEALGADWIPLLQLDSNETDEYNLSFYEAGTLYLMIERSRLKRHDFSNVKGFLTSL